MFVDNQNTVIKRQILTCLASLYFRNKLSQEINRLPLQLIKKQAAPYRCCIYKDRALVKYRAIALLGFSLENEWEIDEKPLSEYAELAVARTKTVFPILTFIDDACRSCVRANYFVTDVCRNCVARPCVVGCPKKVISIKNNRAYIDAEGCINCGKCQSVCPYHAIVFIPVPCEEACPVGALGKNEQGRQVIDYTKCIFCGQCMKACPFGAVMEKSQVIDVIKHLKGDKKVAAMVAPSIIGQFSGSLEQITAALKQLGFDYVVEVALGAGRTIAAESAEFQERLAHGDKVMGTSCCPAYVEAVRKHARDFLPYVSRAATPMAYTGQLVTENFPGAVRVFIGPCVAKKHEDLANENVDYVLTYEELACMLEARSISVSDCPEIKPDLGRPSRAGRGFPVSSGVAEAIKQSIGDKCPVEVVLINGLNSKNIKLLNSYAGKCEGNLVEVMSCTGGCMAGPGVIEKPAASLRKLESFLEKSG